MATFVLVHGAWAGAWEWREVERLLRVRGHDVTRPTQNAAAGSRRPRSEWAVASSGSVDLCSCAGCAGLWVAHSDGPFLQEWAVASRRMHGPPEDLLDWGRLQVPVVFPPEGDIGGDSGSPLVEARLIVVRRRDEEVETDKRRRFEIESGTTSG